jgi:hypothetical protein
MANMSYCRFQNTYRDLIDCYDNLNGFLSENEKRYRERLVELCQNIVDEFNPEEEEDEDSEEE